MRISPAFAPLRRGLLLFISVAVLLLPAVDSWPRVSASLAAPITVYTVNSLSDSGTGSGTTGDLRYCLTQANAAGGTNTINFSVTGTITLGSELTISNSATIQGPGVSQLTISGNNAVRVFNISSGNFNVMLADLTIANGKAPISFNQAKGGGIYNQSTGTLTISNCTLSNNVAAVTGTNTANIGYGGAIYNASTGNVLLTGSTLSGNSATANGAVTNNSGYGGGIYNFSTGAVTVTNSTLTGNTVSTSGNSTSVASAGGGIYNANMGAVQISNSTLSNNSVTASNARTGNSAGGGGLYLANAASVTVTGSTLANNSATTVGGGNNSDTSVGGGIYIADGTVTVTNSTLSNNTVMASGNDVTSNSGQGGGVLQAAGTLNVTNSTFSGNAIIVSGNDVTTNTGYGGGLYLINGTANLLHATLANNSVLVSGDPSSFGYGGGLYRVLAAVTTKNTLVARNTATTAGPDLHGAFTSQGYNLIGNNSGGSGFTNGVNNDQAGSTASPLDPLLGPLQNNDGPTQTLALLAGSPAIDKGAAATDPATGNPLTTDQLGLLRPFDDPNIAPATGGNNSDIGAFEAQTILNSAPTITAINPTRQQGNQPINLQIATVNDAEEAENTLTIAVNGGASAIANGVTINNLAVNPAGQVRADVAVTCTATNASFTLAVTDSQNLTANATLTVTVPANTPPVVGNYPNSTIVTGGALTITPDVPPTDNNTVVSVTATATPNFFTGTFSGNTSSGGVTVTNANPAGSYAITVTLTDNCGATTTRSFMLIVNACGAVLSKQRELFAANGGTDSFTVTIDPVCSWTATSDNPDWVTINAPVGGFAGPGTVSYSVATNATSTRRTGSITVAGQVFRVWQSARFGDVPLSHPFYDFIGKLSALGITLGCGVGNYCPDDNTTREQMAIFIERALGVFNPPVPSQQTFQDVPPTFYSYPFIEDFVARGITQGCAAGPPRLFCPTGSVTREQVAIFILRGLGVFTPPAGPQTPTFADVPNSGATDYSYEFIEEFARRGITSGCAAGPPRLYCPTAPVTRGQMAVFLVRAFAM